MPFEVAAQNAAVDAALALVSHTALLDESLTEITGGTPAYARQPTAWDAAASGEGDNTAAETFDVPGGVTVAFLGFASSLAAGNGRDRGWWPLGGQPLQAGVVEESNDTITSQAHGLTDGQRVVFMDLAAAGLPTGLTEGTVYHVRDAATDSFKVSTTAGGAAVNITTDGEALFVRCIPEQFSSQGTYQIASGAIDVRATAV